MLEFKSRWNDNITRERLIQHIPDLIPPQYKVNLGNPDVVLSYQIMKVRMYLAIAQARNNNINVF